MTDIAAEFLAVTMQGVQSALAPPPASESAPPPTSATSATTRTPAVSVIIPVHNRPRLVLETIDSVLAQRADFDDFEVIVVDDASKDNTARAVEGLVEVSHDVVSLVRLAKWHG